MKKVLAFLLTLTMLCGMTPLTAFAGNMENSTSAQNPFAGKTVSILSHSMSTYAGVSNNTAANSTIGRNDIYYTAGKLGVYQKDTWWQQVIDALDMDLLVNNSWSGSCVFMPRKGEASVGYGDRAVNLHNDHTGEEPDIIFVYLGCNDFAYYKDTFGEAADVNYAALITDNGDGTFTYATPTTTCEAYAIMLHKVEHRYPDAKIYCITSTARRETDYTGDSYPDAGQPTAYSAELQKVAQCFGYPVVDLENAIPKEIELFDKYIGDKRAHANTLGMDQITNEVLSVMLGKDAEICHVTSEDGTVQEQAVLHGGSYSAKVELQEGYSVVVTMGGKDVTASAYKDGRITITEVTGDIHVETVINRDPQNYRWEFQNGILTSIGSSENVLTQLSGTVANNILNDGVFQLNTPVVLKHDLPWAVEWKCAEDWRGAVLDSHKESETKTMTFLTRTKGGQLCFGTYTGSQYDNYGIDISGLNADTHTYRLENRIAVDNSNMIWLYVDGEEVGPMNNYFIGSKDQNKTSEWVSGKNFVFSFIGMTGHALRNCQLDYLSVTECAHTYENGVCTGCGAAEPVPTVDTTEALVTALRQAMVQRQRHIELRLNDAALTTSDVAALFQRAREHTGVPKEGDYLRANMVNYSYSVTTGSDASGPYSLVTVDCEFISDAAMEAEVDAAVEKLLKELNLSSATNYEKVKGVYDWITENVEYDYSWDDLEDDVNYHKHTTYAALIEKSAVCQGFASLYYRLMLELGVDCRYISGLSTDITGSERHAWNIVYLDGKYYNCDPTWDRSLMGYYRYFLCTEANFAEHDRDAEFDTADFHARYPMAITPYVQNATASGKINADLAWVLDGDTGTLTVAGTGAIPSYRYSKAPWYDYRESIRKIVVSEGITEVGERAFYWSTNCTEVILPNSLIAIREYGFNNLRNLQTITLPPNLRIIEFCGFSECVALTSITLPDSVTTVGSNAFSNCYKLTSAKLSAGMKTIPDSMFGGDSMLRNVVLPEGVTYIDDTAFINCGFSTFTLPASVTGLGTAVFSGCTSLSRFVVEEGNPAYKSVDGVLFSADGTHLICYPSAKSGNYTVPEGTRYIDYGAFRSAQYLYRVYFPSTLVKIDGYAFSYCRNLYSITLNANILTVGSDAFRSCTALYSVTFQNPDVDLVGYTFVDCTSLRSITLPSNLRQIPNGLFDGCTALQSITIPRTATAIGSSAFLDCDSLTSITIPGTVKSIGQQAFDFCNKLETIILEEGVQTLGFISIRNAPKLKKVVIPKSVTRIEQPSNTDSYMFDDCPNLVLYVECGSYGYSYAQSRGLSYQVSHAIDTAALIYPTCTEQGYTHYRCACGFYDYFSNHTPASGHDFGAWETTVAPTCTAQGAQRRDCTNCDHYETAATPALGHNYGEWTVTTQPTCTANGAQQRDCNHCDHYETDTVAALGHDVVNHAAKAPTCTDIGWNAYETCSRCDYTTYTELPAKGHSYNSVVTAPTCTEQGYTTYTCECGDSYIDDYVDATGHTCENGVCTACGVVCFVPGDADGDGAVNNRDLGLLQRYLNEWSVTVDALAADLDADGTLNNHDLALLQRKINEWEATE